MAFEFHDECPKDGEIYAVVSLDFPRLTESGHVFMDRLVRWVDYETVYGMMKPGHTGTMVFKIPKICPFHSNTARTYWYARRFDQDGLLLIAYGHMREITAGEPKCPRCVCAFEDDK
ncbi:MAG: hypothetical protein GWN86_24565 [Desulfobacterales bacterium]|nr:hypothetical protein [Desulfobacterales bacterium]